MNLYQKCKSSLDIKHLQNIEYKERLYTNVLGEMSIKNIKKSSLFRQPNERLS